MNKKIILGIAILLMLLFSVGLAEAGDCYYCDGTGRCHCCDGSWSGCACCSYDPGKCSICLGTGDSDVGDANEDRVFGDGDSNDDGGSCSGTTAIILTLPMLCCGIVFYKKKRSS